MGPFKMPRGSPSSATPESSCGYLLQELKLIWDEVGQDQIERERILHELEQECIDVYRRKVDGANILRVRLHQALADSEAELTNLLLSLGERSFPGRPEKLTGSLKEQLDAITPALHEMQLRKEERVNQFLDVLTQIQRVSSEIAGHQEDYNVLVNEGDLSLKKLEEYQSELQRLLIEKNDRLRKVEDFMKVVKSLTETMGMDYSSTISGIHPSLLGGSTAQQSKSISDTILGRLSHKVEQLKDEQHKRMEKLCRLGKALKNLWNLMDTSFEERQKFSYMKFFTSPASLDHNSRPGSLSIDIINQVESEVERLDLLKASKMKELFLRKQSELKEICNKSHLELPSELEMERTMDLIMSGEMEHAELLAIMEEQIFWAKEEAWSRRDIMEKVERWMAACEEERWLEEYSRDDRRYSVSRGAHKNLKRAERARIIVSKIPALIELLMLKTKIWEGERKKIFLYDKVPLVAMLEEYVLQRQEKEKEKQRQRERKKMQDRAAAGQESLFGSRPSTGSSRHLNKHLNGSFSSGTCYPSVRGQSIIAQRHDSKDNCTSQRTSVQKHKDWSNCSSNPNFIQDAASEISVTFSG